jgi:hypothetical protein
MYTGPARGADDLVVVVAPTPPALAYELGYQAFVARPGAVLGTMALVTALLLVDLVPDVRAGPALPRATGKIMT